MVVVVVERNPRIQFRLHQEGPANKSNSLGRSKPFLEGADRPCQGWPLIHIVLAQRAFLVVLPTDNEDEEEDEDVVAVVAVAVAVVVVVVVAVVVVVVLLLLAVVVW